MLVVYCLHVRFIYFLIGVYLTPLHSVRWLAPLFRALLAGTSPREMRAYLTLFVLAGVSALRPYAGIAAPRLPLAASVRMSDAPATAGGIDWAQTAKYPLATAAQAGLIATFFRAVDACGQLPAPFVPPLFAFLSLRSRLFSPLPANRPPRGGFEVDGKRVPTPAETIRPWWTPPGIAFPFIWLVSLPQPQPCP